jgi:hypothetical protein
MVRFARKLTRSCCNLSELFNLRAYEYTLAAEIFSGQGRTDEAYCLRRVVRD